MTELILTINVTIYDVQALEGNHAKIVMIPFSAEAKGNYFNGKTVARGVDTQVITDNSLSLSARYMLEGTDCAGETCRLFIENNGASPDHCIPKIYTDSKALAFLETAALAAKVEGSEGGVVVKIYRVSVTPS